MMELSAVSTQVAKKLPMAGVDVVSRTFRSIVTS